MPSVSTTIEESSPMLVYSAGWTSGSSETDDLTSKYSAGTFMATQVNGATVTFAFNGTGIQLFGAKRSNHGAYQVTIDGNSFPPGSGAGPDEFQTLLFTTTSLTPGLHKLVLTNQEDKFFDLDFVTWQNDHGRGNEPLQVDVVQDSDPSFKYSPGWSTNPDRIGSFMGGTGHQASAPDASFTYSFNGDAVSLYGPVGADFAPFAVQVDGGSAATFTASRAQFQPQVLLYRATNLGRGQHTLKLTSQATSSGQKFAIDYASIFSTESLGGISGSASGSSSGSSGGGGLSGGAGAGIAIAIIAILALAIGAFLYFRRKPRQQSGPSTMIIEKMEAGNYMATPPEAAVTAPVPRRNSSFGHMNPPSSYTFNQTPMLQTNVPAQSPSEPSPVQGSPRYASSEAGSTGQQSSSSNSQMRLVRTSLISTTTNSTDPRNNGGIQYSSKGRRLHLPTAAGQSLADVSTEELQANRRVVDGRPQDFGSVDPSRYTVGGSETLPPPDYSQAIEPYPARGPQ